MSLPVSKKLCVVAACLLLFGAVQSGPPAFAEEEDPLISLSEARRMAREIGPEMQRAELEFEMAREQLADVVGIYDSVAMRADLEKLEDAVEEWEEKLARQRELIAALEEEKEGLEEEDPRLEEIEEELAEARAEEERLKEERNDLRLGRSQLLIRYRSAKAIEDRMDVDQLRTMVDRYEDRVEIMPRITDYLVADTYFNLLALGGQEEMLQEVLSYQEFLYEVELLKHELGLSAAAEVARQEESVRESRQNLQGVKDGAGSLRRAFKMLIGLPLDASFALYDLQPTLPDMEQLEALGPPDLEDAVEYRRAKEDLEDARRDLEDTSPLDARKYRVAELEVAEAELELEETLKELQADYEAKKEGLASAGEEYENAKFALQEAERRLEHSRLQYEVGFLSGLAFRGQELELLEKELSYFQARLNYYLKGQAYQLARDGISVD